MILINFCLSHPELENKEQYELLLNNLSKLQINFYNFQNEKNNGR